MVQSWSAYDSNQGSARLDTALSRWLRNGRTFSVAYGAIQRTTWVAARRPATDNWLINKEIGRVVRAGSCRGLSYGDLSGGRTALKGGRHAV